MARKRDDVQDYNDARQALIHSVPGAARYQRHRARLSLQEEAIMTKQPPPILITDLGAPPAEPTGGFRLWERAVLGFAPLAAAAPLICCATLGRAGWSVMGLLAAPVGMLSVAITRSRRDTAPEVPVSAPGWAATWSDYSGTVVRAERAA